LDDIADDGEIDECDRYEENDEDIEREIDDQIGLNS